MPGMHDAGVEFVTNTYHLQVIYVLEVVVDGSEARVSSISEFLLMNPCLSFAVVDACAQAGSNQINNVDNGFQTEQDWPIGRIFAWSLNLFIPIFHLLKSVAPDQSEDDFECGRSQRASVSIKLYSVHSRLHSFAMALDSLIIIIST